MLLPARPAVLGVDVGGVIIDRDITLRQSWIFCQSEHYLKVPPVAGAFSSLRQLYHLFDGRVVVISKCNTKTRSRTEEWLTYHRFSEATGIERVIFEENLAKKATACKEAGVTHFVDNRIAFLNLLHLPQKNRLLLSANGRLWGKLRRPNGSGIKIFTNWPDIVAHLKQQV